MNIINLTNGQTFRTNNDEAAKAIERVVHYIPGICGNAVTVCDYESLSEEAKKVFDKFKDWNELLIDKINGKDVIISKDTLCYSIGLTDTSLLDTSRFRKFD